MNKNYRLPVRKNGIKTFNKILKTSKKLFAEKGYSNTSINEIISIAGIATGTFYQYFDDKLAVYEYLLFQYHREIRRQIRTEIDGLVTRYDMEREGLKAFLKYISKDKLAYKIIWESLFIDIQLFKNYYITFAESYVNQLKIARDKKELRHCFDLETLAYSLMGIANFTAMQVMFKPNITEKEIDLIVDNAMILIDSGMFVTKNEKSLC